MGTAGVQVGKENEKFTVVYSRCPKTLNLVISRCFAADGKEKYKNIKRYCFVAFSLPSPLLKLLILLHIFYLHQPDQRGQRRLAGQNGTF